MATHTIKHVEPMSVATVTAVIYGIMGCIVIPFALLGLFSEAGVSTLFVLVMPLLYALGGFVGGLIGGALYNLAAGWVGGITVEFDG